MAPSSPPRRPGRDVAELGAHLQGAIRADIGHRRRSLAGAALALALLAGGLGGLRLIDRDLGDRPPPPRVAPPARAAAPVPGTGAAPEGPTSRAPIAEPASTTTAPAVPPPLGETPHPASPLVLVDRHRHLPPGYEPAGLVEPAVPFVFSGSDPKRLLRPEAARALEGLFAAAARDGMPLAAVSGYRSEQTQRDLFSIYAAREGEEAASRTSARPGHSEHQTGLAVDVTGADGACPASACFGDRSEAAWLAAHAHRYGYVVRYPLGKEAVTGYDYEPWHLRYVGTEVATILVRDGLTLDEHLGAVRPEPR